MPAAATVQHDRELDLVVSRFEPGTDEEPRPRSYRVSRRPDWTVLDALHFVKDELDGSLAYRWSCRMGICGSCGMMIDGEPRLACSTFLHDHGEVVRIGPLAHFPVVRERRHGGSHETLHASRSAV